MELHNPGPDGESNDNWNEALNRLEDGTDDRPRQLMA